MNYQYCDFIEPQFCVRCNHTIHSVMHCCNDIFKIRNEKRRTIEKQIIVEMNATEHLYSLVCLEDVDLAQLDVYHTNVNGTSIWKPVPEPDEEELYEQYINDLYEDDSDDESTS